MRRFKEEIHQLSEMGLKSKEAIAQISTDIYEVLSQPYIWGPLLLIIAGGAFANTHITPETNQQSKDQFRTVATCSDQGNPHRQIETSDYIACLTGPGTFLAVDEEITTHSGNLNNPPELRILLATEKQGEKYDLEIQKDATPTQNFYSVDVFDQYSRPIGTKCTNLTDDSDLETTCEVGDNIVITIIEK